jgi:hypothetical protein
MYNIWMKVVKLFDNVRGKKDDDDDEDEGLKKN